MIRYIIIWLSVLLSDKVAYIYFDSKVSYRGTKHFKHITCEHLPTHTNLQSILSKIVPKNTKYLYDKIPYYQFTHDNNKIEITYEQDRIFKMIIHDGLDVFVYVNKKPKVLSHKKTLSINDTVTTDHNPEEQPNHTSYNFDKIISAIQNMLQNDQDIVTIQDFKTTKIQNSTIYLGASFKYQNKNYYIEIDPLSNQKKYKNQKIDIQYRYPIESFDINYLVKNKIILKRSSLIKSPFTGIIIDVEKKKISILDHGLSFIAVIDNVTFNSNIKKGQRIKKNDIIGKQKNHIFYQKIDI